MVVLLSLIECDNELHHEVNEKKGAHRHGEQPSIPKEAPLELLHLEDTSIESYSETEEDHLIEVDHIGGEETQQKQAIKDPHHIARYLVTSKAFAKVQ